MADRPESTKAGEVAINIPETVLDSADQVADALGLPEPGPFIKRVTPDAIADAFGVPTLDDVSDDLLRQMDETFDYSYRYER